MITDSCPSCHLPGDLDLSLAAWNTFSGNEGPSRYEGTWEFIECPKNFVDGPARLRVKVKFLIRFMTLQQEFELFLISKIYNNTKLIFRGDLLDGGMLFNLQITDLESKKLK